MNELEQLLDQKISMRDLYWALRMMDRHSSTGHVGQGIAWYLMGFTNPNPKQESKELQDYLDDLWKT